MFEAVPAPDPLSDPNLLCCILRWLSPVDLIAASAVCRFWGAAVTEPGFWETIDVESLWKALRKRVLARCPQHLRAYLLLHRTLLSLLKKYRQHVRRLIIDQSRLPYLGPPRPGSQPQSSGSSQGTEPASVEDPAAYVVLLGSLPPLPLLEELDISAQKGVPGTWQPVWGSLLSGPHPRYPRLRTLKLRNHDELVQKFIPPTLPDPAGPSQHTLDVTSLDLKGVQLDSPYAPRSRVPAGRSSLGLLLDHLASGRRLRHLALGWGSEAEDGQTNITRRVHCMATSSMLDDLARCAATLEHLDMSGLFLHSHHQFGPPRPGQTLLGLMTSLVTLNMSNVRVISMSSTWVGLSVLAPPGLVGLNLRGCDWVGESALLSCLEHTPLLERLNVSCCDELGDRVLRALPQLCPKLTLLDVCYCSEMSVAGLLGCVGSLRCLTDIGFSGFKALSDEDLRALLASQAHTRLQMLGFGGCPALTDAALAALSESACTTSSLTSLYAANLPGISDGGVRHVIQACPQLQYVCIKDCAGLSPAYQQEVEAMKPYTYDGDTRA